MAAMFLKDIREFKKDRQKLLKSKIMADDLVEQSKPRYENFANMLIGMEAKGIPVAGEMLDGLYEYLMVCLDVYTYSEYGSVMIDDHTYDIVMNIYRDASGTAGMSHADVIQNLTTWKFVEHEAPFMVGTITNKLYTFDALDEALHNLKLAGYNAIFYAPKFDGVSACVSWDGHDIAFAVTRNDGVQGQDITEVVKVMNSAKHIFSSKNPPGYYKVELVVSTEDFNTLQEIKAYANRRSSASGIISTPKNKDLGVYLTAIPLAWVNYAGDRVDYIARHYLSGMVDINPRDMRTTVVHETILDILHKIRQPDFPFRVDGVVMFPVPANNKPNTNDLMADSMAYKVNTQETFTKVIGVYMSVGRTGLGKPMARVEPCELNETVCCDVSLGSMDIFSSLGLHRNEEVIVYAAGDVVPQLKLPEERRFPRNATRFKMDIHCPYCGSSMRFRGGVTSDIYCLNPDCPRVRSGRIVNFLVKLDVGEGFRDEIFYKLVDKHVINGIVDLFQIDKYREQIARIIGPNMADQLITSMDALTTKEYEISQVIGACGIEGIATRTCQKIFREFTIHYLMHQDPERMMLRLLSIDGIGPATAETMCKWLAENHDFIEFLMNKMRVIDDPVVYGNVVFTGFRNKDYQPLFKRIGFPVVEGVNGDTVAVVYVGDLMTGNAKKAAARNIPLIHFSDIDILLKHLEDESDFISKSNVSYTHDDIIRGIRRRL